MANLRPIVRTTVLGAALLALIPLGRIVVDWVEVARMVGGLGVDPQVRGYDWVSWQEDDGQIVAAYVFPRGPRGAPGIQEGDAFFQLDYQTYFNLEALQSVIESIPPGSVRTYTVLRGPQMEEVYVDVLFTRYPTFLYPLSTSLWHFSIWGFVVGVFFHVLGLMIAIPLARFSNRARFSVLLITVSSLWMVGNLLRLVLVDVFDPPGAGSTAEHVFRGLTLLGLVGWIGFPALLLRKVVLDVERLGGFATGPVLASVYVPPGILGLAALATTIRGSIGPLTLDGLIAPILFYACCYIAAAGVLGIAPRTHRAHDENPPIDGWPRLGSILMLVVSVLVGLSVLGVVPILGAVNETMAGWLVVSAQLLSLAPVILVSLATLKHGNVDQVLTRTLTYLTVLGLIFFAFVGGMTLAEPSLDRIGVSSTVVAGLYVVLLLVIFERLARRMRVYAAHFFLTDRQQTRQRLSRFQERMRTILDYPTLARETINEVGEAFRIRSGRLYLRPFGEEGAWISSAFHPEPPYLTERVMSLVWPSFREHGTIWARNPELNESTLPRDLSYLLQERGVALAVPILGEGSPIGLLALGPKRTRRAVFNLEDLDQLRSLSGQLALAIERLQLVERERALIRQSAEAQLAALRAQINPHFLFNALNTIVALIEEQPDQAVEAVENLSAIFRHILQVGSRPFVTLQEEFALVTNYLGIEKARFGPRLTIEQDLDPALRTFPVPAFVVQTLVENAVKHGLEKRRDGGTLRLHARPLADNAAEVIVADTGIGIPALFGRQAGPVDGLPFFGIGLRNITGRLEKLYHRSDLLRFYSAPEAGTTVHLLLPPPPEPAGSPEPPADVANDVPLT